jgi:hypothetical protein
VFEPPPAGFRPAAPPSELRDQEVTRCGVRPSTEVTGAVQVGCEGIPGLRSGRRSWSRRRGSNPLLLAYEASVLAIRTSPARSWNAVSCGRRDSNPHPRRGAPGSSPLDDDHVSWIVGLRWTPGRDSHPRDTVCSRAPRSSATGRWLPGRGSNPHLPGNGRTSCRSTTWHGRATDGCCGN